jgi:alkaline phosphatase D
VISLSREVRAAAFNFGAYPDRIWIGPDFWANRLQDWRIRGGRLECIADDPVHRVRTLHLITREAVRGDGGYELSVTTGVLTRNNGEGWSGFLVGAGAGELDYRAAALVHCLSGKGGGILAVWNTESGRLEFRDMGRDAPGGEHALLAASKEEVQPPEDGSGVRLELIVLPAGDGRYDLLFNAQGPEGNAKPVEAILRGREEREVIGSVALAAGPEGKRGERGSTFWFKDLTVGGEKLKSYPDRSYGPLAASLYTTAGKVLKLTAQFFPLGPDRIDPESRPRRVATHQATLEYRPVGDDGGKWQVGPTARIRASDRCAHFRVEDWDQGRDWEYRIILRGWDGPVGGGTIRRDPVDKPVVSLAAFTGMGVMGLTAYDRSVRSSQDPWSGRWTPANVWFPHAELVGGVRAREVDILFFTGDQIYEHKPSPNDRTDRFPMLDYLYKWYLWCWSFGELTKDIPSVCQVDDHDVYQGNIWGAGGRLNLTGFNGAGGYMMDPIWVNAVQNTQCWHLPDAFSPTPVGAGINVYYTGFNYGGIGFAVLEDRKFKRPPPPRDSPGEFEPVLLGDSQCEFLSRWGADWSGSRMKVVVSQSVYASAHVDRQGNGVIGRDSDTGGFPKEGRDRALELFRRAGALVVCGDQHLATVTRLGIDRPGDAVYQFCVPPVGNIFWRWFYPSVPGTNREPRAPGYTGDFVDGFGNHFRMIAVANPQNPAVFRGGIPIKPGPGIPAKPVGLPDGIRFCKGDGYGIVLLDKANRKIRMECWPYDAAPAVDGSGLGQFAGWPLVLDFEDLDGRRPTHYLPDLVIESLSDPVVQVVSDKTGDILYTRRAQDGFFRPGVFAQGRYTLRVGEPGLPEFKAFEGLEAGTEAGESELRMEF